MVSNEGHLDLELVRVGEVRRDWLGGLKEWILANRPVSYVLVLTGIVLWQKMQRCMYLVICGGYILGMLSASLAVLMRV